MAKPEVHHRRSGWSQLAFSSLTGGHGSSVVGGEDLCTRCGAPAQRAFDVGSLQDQDLGRVWLHWGQFPAGEGSFLGSEPFEVTSLVGGNQEGSS